ncbi:hypothetical protein PR048_021990 [Dryococelus australis]|uniref:Reverse transcriptase domain-containing protein n=1 Tax=Dryococelus australis TaxID=614101 RepID=A0ABQ9GZU4_9NEOP|nr:hypothetical protein PR048_021990 [Dryococelus australis]
MDEVVKQWLQLNKAMGIEGVQIGYKIKHNVIVDCLAFVDDMALLNEKEKDVKMALANLAEITRRIAKLRHYTLTIRNASMYATVALMLGKRTCIRLKREERKILRTIWGTKKQGEFWIHRSRQKLYESIEPILSVIRKRRLRFGGHLMRMNDNRLTKKIWNVTCLKGNSWMKEVREDWKAIGVMDKNPHTIVQDRVREKSDGVIEQFLYCIQAKDVKVSETEFNSDFLVRIIPKLDWNTLWTAADSVMESCKRMPLVGEFSLGSPVSPAPAFRCSSILTSITIIGSQDLAIGYSAELPKTIIENFESNEVFLKKVHRVLLEGRGNGRSQENLSTNGIVRHDSQMRKSGVALRQSCLSLSYNFMITLCEELINFLLQQVDVVTGDLVCPESGRKFPINESIPNMLLNEDEL